MADLAAEPFFAPNVATVREYGWTSEAHFSVDGTLIDAWASLKSFQPKDGPKNRSDRESGKPTVDFHGDKRSSPTLPGYPCAKSSFQSFEHNTRENKVEKQGFFNGLLVNRVPVDSVGFGANG